MYSRKVPEKKSIELMVFLKGQHVSVRESERSGMNQMIISALSNLFKVIPSDRLDDEIIQIGTDLIVRYPIVVSQKDLYEMFGIDYKPSLPKLFINVCNVGPHVSSSTPLYMGTHLILVNSYSNRFYVTDLDNQVHECSQRDAMDVIATVIKATAFEIQQ